MSNRLIVFFWVLLSSVLNGQISVKTNLPEQIKVNSEVTFEAKIWKGPIKNFSKYQMEVPEGVTITEVDCKTGSFAQEGNTVKIIWAITPSETEFTISLKLNAGQAKGPKTIVHKYYYLEKGEKREVEMAPVNIDFVDNLGEPSATSPAVAENGSLPGKDELKEQVVQLRKDAREAREVGDAEKLTARKKQADAELAIKKAKAIASEKERTTALQKAMAAKDKANTDLAMAERILTLAKSLEDNADEIEKLNQSLELAGVGDSKSEPVTTGGNAVKENTSTENNAAPVKAVVNGAEIEKSRQNAINKGTKDAQGLYKPVSVNPHNVKELIQQVEQIKKDAREARQVGNREKNKAEQKLSDSYEALKRAEYINDAEEKRLALEKANQDKAKAEKELEVAAKILTLANSLEENAREIEDLSAPTEEPDQVGQMEVVANTSTITTRVVPKTENQTGSPAAPKTVAKEKKTVTPDVVKAEAESGASGKTETSNSGTVYKLQVGAFEKTPDRLQFKSLGKVEVVKEGAMYKAFFGNFKSREEANAAKDGVRAKGFDPFTVTFKDGVKVK